MSTFIETYGHVKYGQRRFKAEGPCEIPGCEILRVENYVHALVWDFKMKLAQFQRLYGSSFRKTGHYELWPYKYKPAIYVVEHCHVHGYIRGITCRNCNNVLALIDEIGYAAPKSWQVLFGVPDELRWTHILGLADFRKNCPECAEDKTFVPANFSIHLPRWLMS